MSAGAAQPLFAAPPRAILFVRGIRGTRPFRAVIRAPCRPRAPLLSGNLPERPRPLHRAAGALDILAGALDQILQPDLPDILHLIRLVHHHTHPAVSRSPDRPR